MELATLFYDNGIQFNVFYLADIFSLNEHRSHFIHGIESSRRNALTRSKTSLALVLSLISWQIKTRPQWHSL